MAFSEPARPILPPSRSTPTAPTTAAPSPAGRPLKIGLVSDCYVPRLGGIEMQVHDLARNLQLAGHDVVVITPTPGPELVDGVRVHRMDVPLLPFDIPFTPATFRQVSELLRQRAGRRGPLRRRHRLAAGVHRRGQRPGRRRPDRHHHPLPVELRHAGVQPARQGLPLDRLAGRALVGERRGRRPDPQDRRARRRGRGAAQRHRQRRLAGHPGAPRPRPRHDRVGHAAGPAQAPDAPAQDDPPGARAAARRAARSSW